VTDSNHNRKVPKLGLHKPSGKARVRLSGVDFYTGEYGTAEAQAAYDKLIGEWLAAGRKLTGMVGRYAQPATQAGGMTIAELVLAYDDWCQERLDKHTADRCIRPALRRLRQMFGAMPAAAFDPGHLCQLQAAAVEERNSKGRRLSRRYINAKVIGRLKTMFKWAAKPSRAFIPVSVYTALTVVEPLKRKETTAPDRAPIRPVSDEVVDKTIPFLPQVVADMVRVQRLTGARPGEVCRMSWAEIDRNGPVWTYQPARHKTEHHGHTRTIPLGPKAQSVLMRYIHRPAGLAIFSPAENERQRLEERHAGRTTPLSCGNLPGDSSRGRKPRQFSDHYDTEAYGKAIARACARAGVERWAPNRLRHSAATAIRKQFGLDAAGATLGHAKVDVTQVYAERAHELAFDVARQVG
jgi:integrase